MPRNDVVIRVAGEAGEGVVSVAEILTRAAVNSDLDVFTFRTYPAEIKGGLAMMQVRMSTHNLESIGRHADVLMAFNQEAVDVWGESLTPNGILLFDPKHCQVPDDFPFHAIPVPLHETSMQETGARINKNIVALATLVHALGIPEEKAKDLIIEKFKRKGDEVIDKNLKAFDAGVGLLNGNPRVADLRMEKSPTHKSGRIIISGNQAISMGALAAGCNFVAGYPITPATQVLEFMMKYLPGLHGSVVQAEDEISAIAACLGASYAGAKAMTATSGPGLCLMSELIGLASMAEIPLVIFDVQRSGPSTGMPTKTEQSDLMYAIHGSAGEAPRIVLAATSIEDCFHQAINAFNLAERFQVPVILLSDQSMAYRTSTIDVPDMEKVTIENRRKPGAVAFGDYARYLDTATGVSPVTVPGTPGGMFVASGLEHDEGGAPNYTPANREKMVAKRYRKLDTLEKELNANANGNGRFDTAGGAEIGVIGWGSTEGPIREAINRLRDNGIRVAHMHPKVLMPLAKEKMQRFLNPLKKVIVFEENHTGQLSKHLRSHLKVDPIEVNQCTGMPFTPDDVYTALKGHV